MAYERYPRSTGPQGDYSDNAGYGRDPGRSGNGDRDGRQDYGNQGYGQRPSFDRDRESGRGNYGPDRSAERPSDRGYSNYGRPDDGRRQNQGWQGQGVQGQGVQGQGAQGQDGDRYQRGGRDEYHGSYASDGHRFEDVGRNRDADDDNRRNDRGYGRQPQGYDYEDRGFFQRAGDEVRSWFGDDDAERRREADSRYDERSYRNGGQHDDHYGSWRSSQIAAFDRDYDEYRHENRSRFESEFSSWRTNRQTQRDSLGKVKEHQEVVGSDGAHVGTVDKVRGDRILLTRTDADAGGRHHSIPSNWLASVNDKVTLSKTADEAKSAWRDEDRNQAMFGYGDNDRGGDDRGDTRGATDRTGSSAAAASSADSEASASSTATTATGDGNPNRSFPGTY